MHSKLHNITPNIPVKHIVTVKGNVLFIFSLFSNSCYPILISPSARNLCVLLRLLVLLNFFKKAEDQCKASKSIPAIGSMSKILSGMCFYVRFFNSHSVQIYREPVTLTYRRRKLSSAFDRRRNHLVWQMKKLKSTPDLGQMNDWNVINTFSFKIIFQFLREMLTLVSSVCSYY